MYCLKFLNTFSDLENQLKVKSWTYSSYLSYSCHHWLLMLLPKCAYLTVSHWVIHHFIPSIQANLFEKNLWLMSVIKEIKRTGFQQSLMFCLHDHFKATDFLTTVGVPSQNKFHLCHLKNVQNENVCSKILTYKNIF